MGIDATTLETNAAMRSIVRRDNGETYGEFLRGFAKASGIETPTREDLARLDQKRKRRMSNKEWKSPVDEDARIAKMKDGAPIWRTRPSAPRSNASSHTQALPADSTVQSGVGLSRCYFGAIVVGTFG